MNECGRLLKSLPAHQLTNLPLNEMRQFINECEPQNVATAD